MHPLAIHSAPKLKKNCTFWKLNFLNKIVWPRQDSNLQSPDSKSGALSIRPHCSLSFMYSNYSFIFAKQQHVLQRSVKQRLSSYFMNWLERKMLICCSDSSTWNSFSYGCSAFTFSFSPATIMSCRLLTRAHESCLYSLWKQRDHIKFFSSLLSYTEKYIYQLLVTRSPDYLTTLLLVAWSF